MSHRHVEDRMGGAIRTLTSIDSTVLARIASHHIQFNTYPTRLRKEHQERVKYSMDSLFNTKFSVKALSNFSNLWVCPQWPRCNNILLCAFVQTLPFLCMWSNRSKATTRHLKNVYSALALTMLSAFGGAIAFFVTGFSVSMQCGGPLVRHYCNVGMVHIFCCESISIWSIFLLFIQLHVTDYA